MWWGVRSIRHLHKDRQRCVVAKVVVRKAKEAKGAVVAYGLAQGLDGERQPHTHLVITTR